MANANEALVYGWTPQSLGATAGESGYAQPGNAPASTTVSTAEQVSAGAPNPLPGSITQILENPGYASSGIFSLPDNEGGGFSLTRTAVQTTTYTAAANQIVPCDTTSGAFTVTLPTAPAADTVVVIKMVTQSGTNAVTYACGGSDVFNKTSGATSGTLTLLNQGVLLQYNGSGIWTVLSDDLPLSQLDLRYLELAGGTLTGYVAPAVATLTFVGSGTTLVNAALGNAFNLTLTASTTTLGNPSNPVDGQVIRFRITQGTGGSFTLAYGSAYDFGAAGAPTLTTTAAKVDILSFMYVASISKWAYLGGSLGF